MTKVVVILGVLHLFAFLAAWMTYPEISALPLGGLVGISACTIFYTIDRYGFRQIDTIANLRANPWLFLAHLGVYAVLILSGYVLAWITLR